jgi:hypothetical protein
MGNDPSRQPTEPNQTLRNGTGGAALSNEPQQRIPDELDPKIKDWLSSDVHYTSYSKDTFGQKNMKDPGIVSVSVPKMIEQTEPELNAIESLQITLPLVYNRETKHLFPNSKPLPNRGGIICPSEKPLLTMFLYYQNKLKALSQDIASKQDKLSNRVLDTEDTVNEMIVRINTLMNNMQTFETQLTEISAARKSIDTANEKLKHVIRIAQDLVDVLPSDEREGLEFPLEITAPHLIKDYYARFNHWIETPYFKPSASYEQKAYEERWINEVLGNLDSAWTEQPNAKALWRKGIPAKFRAILWRQIVGNKLNVTADFYNQLRSEDNVQEAIVSVHLEKNPIKLLLELKQKQDEEPKAEDNPQPTSEGAVPEITVKSPRQKILALDNEQLKQLIQQQQRTIAELKSFIDLDLPRTFSDLTIFKDPSSKSYDEIMSVLIALARSKPDIGYVQGMSYLAGLLLMYLQEADAFIMLYNLLDSHFLSSMYHVDLAQISKHFRIFEILFAEQLPLLYKHFRSLGISNEHYLLDWYLTLFIKQLKPPIASRVWDCYLIEGDIFIHFTALAILKYFESTLLLRSFEECLNLLGHLPQDIDENKLFSLIDTLYIPLHVEGFIKMIDITTPQNVSPRKSPDATRATDDPIS